MAAAVLNSPRAVVESAVMLTRLLGQGVSQARVRQITSSPDTKGHEIKFLKRHPISLGTQSFREGRDNVLL